LSLLDEMDQDVVAYRPERENEGVEGVIVALDVTGSDYTTDDIPVITLKQDDGVLRGVRAYHSVLRNEINKAGVSVGDRLAIVYLGKKSNQKGTGSYHAYRVRIARGSGDSGADAPAPF
jgi:hypothetical protein